MCLGCGPLVDVDGTQGQGTDVATTSAGGGTSTGTTTTITTATITTATTRSSTTTENTTAMSATTTGSMTTDTTSVGVGSGTGSSGGGCEGECRDDEDCQLGQVCIGCLCFGRPTGCDPFTGVGAYAECVVQGQGPCMNPEAACLTDDPEMPTGSVCMFLNCTSACDCPPPPEGFEDLVTCADLVADEQGECYLSCENDTVCPDGMFCLEDTICVVAI